MAHAPPITEKWVQRRVVQPGACCGFPDKEREAKARYPLIKPIATTTLLFGVLAAGPALANGKRCQGTLSGGQYNQIVVPAGALCTLAGVRSDGDVKVAKGASLSAQRARVGGNIQADGARSVQVSGGSVYGDIQAKQGGDVRVDGMRIDGNLQIEQNAIIAHVIDGDLQVFKNRGDVRIRGNAINGNLQCKENRVGVTGQGNRADDKEHQCARL